MARMDPVLKRRLGYILYMIEAFRIWASHPFPLFEVTVRNGNGDASTVHASQILAVRIRSFWRGTGAACFREPACIAHTFRWLRSGRAGGLHYFRFLMAVMAGRQKFSRDVELITAT